MDMILGTRTDTRANLLACIHMRLTLLACSCCDRTCCAAAAARSLLTAGDFEGTDGQANISYHLRVCGVVSSGSNARCQAVDSRISACQTVGDAIYDLGNWDSHQSPQWEYINSTNHATGVQYTLEGANQWSVHQPQSVAAAATSLEDAFASQLV
jgi:hypothetical protein